MGKQVLAFIITVSAVALQGCGHERHGGPPGGMHMRGAMGPGGGSAPSREFHLRRFDANADGTITRDEFMKVIAADYAVADTNHDGRISGIEAMAFNSKQQASQEVSPIIDWDGDGTISMDEFAAQWRTLFERADADHDGVVTAEELARPQMGSPGDGPPQGERGGPAGPGDRGHRRGGGPGGEPGAGLTTRTTGDDR